MHLSPPPAAVPSSPPPCASPRRRGVPTADSSLTPRVPSTSPPSIAPPPPAPMLSRTDAGAGRATKERRRTTSCGRRACGPRGTRPTGEIDAVRGANAGLPSAGNARTAVCPWIRATPIFATGTRRCAPSFPPPRSRPCGPRPWNMRGPGCSRRTGRRCRWPWAYRSKMCGRRGTTRPSGGARRRWSGPACRPTRCPFCSISTCGGAFRRCGKSLLVGYCVRPQLIC
mmetsp:Transcript_43248/g.101397  ORF Transcript_43248/g.101397 Transcript_43248/m.101397 type:complete len:227 (-) Transcript_43248:521-1201(-)